MATILGPQKLGPLTPLVGDWEGDVAWTPFHDEVGYLLWDKANGQVMRTVVFGRGIAILAGGDAGPRHREINFAVNPGEPDHGILQNKYLLGRAELRSFESTFVFGDDGSFSYTSDLVLKLASTGGDEIHHTDRNTLHRVARVHPSVEMG